MGNSPPLEAAKFARHGHPAESSLELTADSAVAWCEFEHESPIADIANAQLQYRHEVPRLLQHECRVSLGEYDVVRADPAPTAWGPDQNETLIGHHEIVRRARTEQQRHPPT
jgi:hypothetical protein